MSDVAWQDVKWALDKIPHRFDSERLTIDDVLALKRGLRERGLTIAPVGAVRDPVAIKLLEYALHLMTYGERAPGGDETWAEFARNCETYLRSPVDQEKPQ